MSSEEFPPSWSAFLQPGRKALTGIPIFIRSHPGRAGIRWLRLRLIGGDKPYMGVLSDGRVKSFKNEKIEYDAIMMR